MWRTTRNFKRPKELVYPIMKTNGDWIQNDEDKTDEFLKYFSQVIAPISWRQKLTIGRIQLGCELSNWINYFSTRNLSCHQKYDSKKARGHDLIIEEIATQRTSHTNIHMQCSNKTGILSSSHLKFSQIMIIIRKPGRHPTQMNSYRSIALLSVISKLTSS